MLNQQFKSAAIRTVLRLTLTIKVANIMNATTVNIYMSTITKSQWYPNVLYEDDLPLTLRVSFSTCTTLWCVPTSLICCFRSLLAWSLLSLQEWAVKNAFMKLIKFKYKQYAQNISSNDNLQGRYYSIHNNDNSLNWCITKYMCVYTM